MPISTAVVVAATVAPALAKATTTITVTLVYLHHSRWRMRFREQALVRWITRYRRTTVYTVAFSAWPGRTI
jgi:hypothetical protein